MSLSIKTAYTLGLLVLLSVYSGISQVDTLDVSDDESSRVYSIDLGLNALIPLGTYGDQIRSFEKGFSISSHMQLKPKSSVFIGLELSGHWLQSLDNDVVEFLDIGPIDVNEIYRTHTFDALLSTRIFSTFSMGPIDPFGEVGIGMRSFFATWSQTALDDSDYSSFEFQDGSVAPQLGLAVGGLIHLSEQVFLNFKLRYLRTGKLNYKVKDEDLSYTYPEDGYINTLSTMPTLGFFLGVNWIL